MEGLGHHARLARNTNLHAARLPILRHGAMGGTAARTIGRVQVAMAGIGSPPGVRRGGRQKGSRNKVTQAARLAFEKIYRGRLKDLNRWIQETEKP